MLSRCENHSINSTPPSIILHKKTLSMLGSTVFVNACFSIVVRLDNRSHGPFGHHAYSAGDPAGPKKLSTYLESLVFKARMLWLPKHILCLGDR